MKGKISAIEQNHFLYQAVNILFSAVKLGILTWGVYGIDSLLEPASGGQSMNCSFSHFHVGFTRECGRLPLAAYLGGRGVFDGGSWADLQKVADGLDYPCYKLKKEPE